VHSLERIDTLLELDVVRRQLGLLLRLTQLLPDILLCPGRPGLELCPSSCEQTSHRPDAIIREVLAKGLKLVHVYYGV
jgi:hypothetical protein